MKTYDASPAALRPLLQMHWSAKGWRIPAVPPSPVEMSAAVAAGVMFDRKRSGGHDEWVAAARQAAARTDPAAAGDAFLESFGGGRLDLRSALGSYAVGRALPEHRFDDPTGSGWCCVCSLYPHSDEDLNVLNFERFKWGGVRQSQIPYVAFDLEQFTRAPRHGSTPADRKLAAALFDVLRGLPAGVSRGRTVAAMSLVPGNRDQRDSLLTVLALTGIWRAPWCSTAPELLTPGAAGSVAAGVDEQALHDLLPTL